MKKKYYFIKVIVFLLGQNCIAQNIINEPTFTRVYRHLFFEESEKYINSKNNIIDSFQYFYRPDFQHRYLDEDYIMCRIIQINDTLKVTELPFPVEFGKAFDVSVLDVNIQIIDYYKSRDNPIINTFFAEQLFKEEYNGERIYGLFDYVSYIDSCVQDSTSDFFRLYLLVTPDEIQFFNSFQNGIDSILCNISQIIDSQIYYSDIFYLKSDYNTKEFFSLSEWSSFLHQRIDRVVRSCKVEK